MAEVSFLPSELIKKKRNGFSLSTEEIEFFINGYTKGLIPDYQMSAMLMSIYFKGMTDVETLALTKSMLFSGTVIEFPDVKSFKVDKHSTGGVGDKTSLILGPIVAACGLSVPMISGRGLGHTGGTLDKLESIPGFNTQLNLEQFKHAITEHGICFIGQTKDICPADKKIYALRDVTATVESMPLICASIMSKKLAEGIDGLVLDVKIWQWSFYEDCRRRGAIGVTINGDCKRLRKKSNGSSD
jgi:pyrimidine-nucleoside phosphorylase